jgi:DNA-binding transcriptional ArsR family regulator
MANELTSSELLAVLAALANPHRLQMLAVLTGGPQYVSQLAREIGISRPLVHMHLKRLEDAGLVTSELQLSEDGKAMRFYQVSQFNLSLTPGVIADLVRTRGPFPTEI